MALSAFAGTFTKNTGTGNQAITGVGFIPKVLIMWTAYCTITETITNSYSWAWGMATAATERYSASFSSQQGVATSNTSRRGALKALTVVQYGEVTLAEAELVSFDADGYTVNWTTNTGGSQLIHFLCLGGTDLEGAKVLTYTSPIVTGNFTVTGAGFQPAALLFARCSPLAALALPGSAAGAQFALGCADRNSNQWALHVQMPDATATTGYVTWRVIKSDRCVYSIDTSGNAKDDAALLNYETDGFTLNYTVANAGGGDTVGVLALKATSMAMLAGIFPDNTRPSIGFTPKVVGFAGTQRNSQSAVGNAALYAGATTGATAALNQAAAISDNNVSDGTNTNAFSVDATAKCVARTTTNPNAAGYQVLTSFDSDGWTLSAAISDDLLGYLALGDAPPGSFVDGEEG
jgi:hypothetical protein